MEMKSSLKDYEKNSEFMKVLLDKDSSTKIKLQEDLNQNLQNIQASDRKLALKNIELKMKNLQIGSLENENNSLSLENEVQMRKFTSLKIEHLKLENDFKVNKTKMETLEKDAKELQEALKAEKEIKQGLEDFLAQFATYDDLKERLKKNAAVIEELFNTTLKGSEVNGESSFFGEDNETVIENPNVKPN